MEEKANWFGVLETKYSKKKLFRWPLLLSDAKIILRKSLVYRTVKELEENTVLTIMVDDDLSELGNYALLQETGFTVDALNRVDPFSKIREWSYENIICSALFFVLEKDLEIESCFIFLEVINLLCVHNDTVRQQIFRMLKRNGVIEANPQNFITDFILVLKYERSYNLTDEGLFVLLELLSLEKAFILELLSKKDKNVLIHFLETFTYKSPIRLNHNELKNFLNLSLIKKKKKINQNYEHLKENLENFDFWNIMSECEDFSLPTRYSELTNQFNFEEENFKNFYITFLQLENYNLYKIENIVFSKKTYLYEILEISEDSAWNEEVFDQLFECDFPPFPSFNEIFEKLENFYSNTEDKKNFYSFFFTTKKNKNTLKIFSNGVLGIAMTAGALVLFDSRSLVHRRSQFQLDFGVVRQANTTTALGLNESGIWAQSKPQSLISASKKDQNKKLTRISTSTGLVLPTFQKSVSPKGCEYWINAENQLACFGNVASYDINSKVNGELRDEAKRLGIAPILSVHNADHPLPSGFGEALELRKSGSTVSVPEYVNKGRYVGHIKGRVSYKTPFHELAEQLMISSELDFSNRLDTFIAKYPVYGEFKQLIIDGYKAASGKTVTEIYNQLVNIKEIPPHLTTPFVFYKLRGLYWREDCRKLCDLAKQNNPENVKHAVLYFATHLDKLLEDGQITSSLFKKGCDAWHELDLEMDLMKANGEKDLVKYVQKHKDTLGKDYESFLTIARECRSKDKEIKKFVTSDGIEYLQFIHEKNELGNLSSINARVLYQTESIKNFYPH